MSRVTKPMGRKPTRSGRSHQAGIPPSDGPAPAVTANGLRWSLNDNLAILLLLAGTFVLYSSVGSHPFINYDDTEYVLENPHVKDGLSWETVTWALTSVEHSNWHPLTWISHAFDYQLFGPNPWGHHWTNVVIHAFNATLLFVLLRKATGGTLRSFMVAALFACHPLNVESVAWVAERKNVLSTFLFLSVLFAYGWYGQKPNWKRYLAVIVLFVLALAAKPMVVTLPFVLLLLDYWPLCRLQNWSGPSKTLGLQQTSPCRLLLEKLPLMALSAAIAVITMIAQHVSVAPAEQFSLLTRLTNAPYSYCRYLIKAFWPTQLALFYPHPGNSLPALKWICASLFLIAISAFAWEQRSNRPYLLVGWLWFLGTLVPVLGLVQVGAQAMADRYAYIPLIGIFLAMVWTVKAPVVAEASLATIVLAALSLITWQQIGYWKSDYDLWSHTLAVTGSNLIAEDKLGVALQAMGRQQEAIVHFANAARIDSLDPLSNFNLGADLHWHGRLQEAITHYEITIHETTDARLLADACQNLGTAYLQLGDRTHARESFFQALKANPDLVTVFAGLGELGTETERTLSRSVVEHPTIQGYVHLGRVFQQDGRTSEARLAFAEALKLNPELDEARLALANLRDSPQ